MRVVAALGGNAWAAVVAVVVALNACGGPSPTVPVAEPVPPTTVPTPVVTPVVAGRRAVRVEGIEPTTVVLRFTDAQIFFNEEADRAAREDGHPGGAPNPVWIRDLATTGSLPIASNAIVTLIRPDADGTFRPRPVTLGEFVALYAGPDPGGEYLYLTVEDGLVTAIEEPQLP